MPYNMIGTVISQVEVDSKHGSVSSSEPGSTLHNKARSNKSSYMLYDVKNKLNKLVYLPGNVHQRILWNSRTGAQTSVITS